MWIGYDPSKPPGERLPPEVIEEIKRVAPSNVDNGSITTDKLRDGAVTKPKIGPGAVGDTELALGGVKAAALANSAVTEPKIDDGAVTPPKVGTGVVTVRDSAGNDIDGPTVYLSSDEYAALSPPDPNTFYDVYEEV